MAAFLIGFAAGAELDLMAFLARDTSALPTMQNLLDSLCNAGCLFRHCAHGLCVCL
ncbi:MAG: hypothetical protein CM15mP84_05410 [Cellvibrionales bacterium]|nr:MAG: hypothetical protein CM15mP84_05410 [Cellvibrionales bacterium]